MPAARTSRYLHRRLRKRLRPRVILTSTRPMNAETAAAVKRAWLIASTSRQMLPIVVDGTQFTVKVIR